MKESNAPVDKRLTPLTKPVLSSPPMFDHEKLDVYHLELMDGKKMLVRIVSMLCGLIERFDMQGQLKDESSEPDRNISVRPANYGAKKSRARTRTRTRRNS